MAPTNLEVFFKPQSAAVVGASDAPGRVGYAVTRHLIAGGYRNPICPVNAHRKTINSLPAFASLHKIGQPVDLAVIATPIVVEAVQMGIRGAGAVADAVAACLPQKRKRPVYTVWMGGLSVARAKRSRQPPSYPAIRRPYRRGK